MAQNSGRYKTTDPQQHECDSCGEEFETSAKIDTWSGVAAVTCTECGTTQHA